MDVYRADCLCMLVCTTVRVRVRARWSLWSTPLCSLRSNHIHFPFVWQSFQFSIAVINVNTQIHVLILLAFFHHKVNCTKEEKCKAGTKQTEEGEKKNVSM